MFVCKLKSFKSTSEFQQMIECLHTILTTVVNRFIPLIYIHETVDLISGFQGCSTRNRTFSYACLHNFAHNLNGKFNNKILLDYHINVN